MSTGTVTIYGIIGIGEGEVSHQDVVEQLDDIGQVDTLEIRINSRGGSVWEAMGIYSTLNQYAAHKVVYIDGIALSSASWIACVGDEIFIAENGMYMYHESRLNAGPSTEDELIKYAAAAKQLNQQMAETYATRTKRPIAEIEAGMKATTWLRAKDAVKNGFATAVIPNKAVSAQCDLAIFNDAPEWVVSDLSAISEESEMAKPEKVVTETEVKPAPEVTNESAVETPTPVVSEATATPATKESTAVATPAPEVINMDDIKRLIADGVAAAVGDAVNLALAADRKRAADIREICKLAGTPDAAAKFEDNGTQPTDVMAAMFAHVCATRKPVGPEATNAAEVPDADAKYVAEFNANKATITSMGLTLDQYIKGAKIRAGVA